tara:strand:- start:2281 stop:2868 length:588 start_codon:yes stop_codon:yes gene_type:complete
MKKILCIFLILLLILFPQASLANEELDLSEKLAVSLVVTPFILQHQVFIHESFHALTILSQGTEVTRFAPYPHYMGDRFVLGSVSSECLTCTDAQHVSVLLSPFIANANMFATSDITLTHFVDINTVGGTIIFLGGMVAPYINTTAQFFSTKAQSDWPEMRRLSGDKEVALNVIFGLLIAVGTIRILQHSFEWLN